MLNVKELLDIPSQHLKELANNFHYFFLNMRILELASFEWTILSLKM